MEIKALCVYTVHHIWFTFNPNVFGILSLLCPLIAIQNCNWKPQHDEYKCNNICCWCCLCLLVGSSLFEFVQIRSNYLQVDLDQVWLSWVPFGYYNWVKFLISFSQRFPLMSRQTRLQLTEPDTKPISNGNWVTHLKGVFRQKGKEIFALWNSCEVNCWTVCVYSLQTANEPTCTNQVCRRMFLFSTQTLIELRTHQKLWFFLLF